MGLGRDDKPLALPLCPEQDGRSEWRRQRMPRRRESALGAMPEWRLEHLYPAMDSAAFAADLKRSAEEAAAFAEAYRGKLADLLAAEDGAARLHEAIRRYEALEDLMGRVMSYAG